VSIAQQSATPSLRSRPRRTPLQLAPVPRPGRAIAKILALVALTSLGVAVAAGSVALALFMFAAHVSG
jgi:hypothetical protein